LEVLFAEIEEASAYDVILSMQDEQVIGIFSFFILRITEYRFKKREIKAS
jgi:hypothetical protein